MKPNLMTDLLIYLQPIGKMVVSVKTLTTTTQGAAILVPAISFAVTTDVKYALFFLLIVFFIDFITGIYASFIENRNSKPHYQSEEYKQQRWLRRVLDKILLFFDTITSEKLRKSIVKAIGYSLFILLVFGVERIFVIKSFSLFNISDKNWTITLIAEAFCIAIEIYSILFENIKRAGYDLAGGFVKVIDQYKNIKNEIEK